MDKIDILMATYNGEKYLKEQIESILNQTYSNFRLIVSDDCSTDNTRMILEEYQEKDNRIEIYYQDKNLGYIKNFEFLLNKVENNFYMLSDQDDIWISNKIEKSMKTLKQENADLVFCDLMLINQNGERISDSFWKEKKFYNKIKKDKSRKGLRLNNYITGCTILSKKEFLKYILPIPKGTKYLIHDYWIAIILSLKGKITYIEEPLVKYRQHQDNQVGYKMKSKELKNIDKIRNMFIDVKIELFDIYCKHDELFDTNERKMNQKALEYFKELKNVKNICCKNCLFFWKLYYYENTIYKIANFIILNVPIIAKLIYKRR